ncbi:hypothetical protein [Nocardiopsis sp. JB363]|uniref:hypothetical protein n=1 Tax=Nocardiopsis sp. JB363 TaxID=1434837 RepID=UPI000979D0A6|nr:hypothetical protein [Nocardiopsis sp. JB363]SIO89465.1 hypothetical protein BQ8420_21725 [Nocardiopsis sp. JB363]
MHPDHSAQAADRYRAEMERIAREERLAGEATEGRRKRERERAESRDPRPR